MAFKFVIFAAALACANAGFLPQVATYSAAPAVSSAYIQQAAPALAVAHAAPVVAAAAPLAVAHAPVAYSAAPAVSSSYFQQATPALAVAHAPVAYAQAAPVAYAQAAPLAVAHAAPLAVAHAAPVAIHAPAVGSSHQSVYRSLGGAQAVSHYSKAVDSAFSSVRKYDTRITNDALSVAHAPLAVAHAAPVLSTYAAHATPVVSAYSAAPAAVVSHVSFNGLGAQYAW